MYAALAVAAKRTPRKLVVLCDGTGNQIDSSQSNVLRLYRVLSKSAGQRVFYDPGIGTAGSSEDWVRWKSNTERVLGLATGYGLDENVLNAYRFLLREYRPGDELYFFGFSRGAYTVRVLAGFINAIGLLHSDQQHLLSYAYNAYKRISDKNSFDDVRQFERILRPHRPTIRFLGLWDTVSTILVPRKDRFYLPATRQLAYTERNPSVQQVCHALAIDERRRMFRPYLWKQEQEYWGGPFPTKNKEQVTAQQVQQVWFPGVHSDIGGGYTEQESGLAKLSLVWMVEQLGDLLGFSQRGLNQHAHGKGKGFIEPSALADIHNSMNKGWSALEYLPKASRHREDATRRTLLGWYLPGNEPRLLPSDAQLHSSVGQRMRECSRYRPANVLAEQLSSLEPCLAQAQAKTDGATQSKP